MNTPAAGGAEAIGGCASTVLTAISFHLVTSLACATVGSASASSAATAARPNRAVFIACPLRTPMVSVPQDERTTTRLPRLGTQHGAARPGDEASLEQERVDRRL